MQEIVVGVDGSESSARALAWAVDQARCEHRPLALVHGAGAMTAMQHEAVVVSPADVRRALHEAGEAVVAAALAQVGEQVRDRGDGQPLDVRTEVLDVDARQALVDSSADAALVVVGSRGHGPVGSLLLGSVSVAVARHSHCPVVVHRPTRNDGPREGVVVAVDGHADSTPVLEFAWRQADLRGSSLTLLHCYWEVQAVAESSELVGGTVSDRLQERVEVAEAVAGMREKHPDVHVRTRVARSLPERAVAEAADAAELVVVGSHRLSLGQRLMFGSVSTAILEHAACPVAVVPVRA